MDGKGGVVDVVVELQHLIPNRIESPLDYFRPRLLTTARGKHAIGVRVPVQISNREAAAADDLDDCDTSVDLPLGADRRCRRCRPRSGEIVPSPPHAKLLASYLLRM